MSVGKVSEFDVSSGAWSSYVDRLESYFLVNAVKEELKLPTLIAVMGDEAYELLANLASPTKPAELKYKNAVEMMRNHLQATPSALAERYRFRQRRQAIGENIATYVAELKKLARNCKFDANLSENLRDQIVCGIRSDVSRQRLFAEDDTLSFTKAVKIASSLEAAERDAAAVEAPGGEHTAGSGGSSGHAMHALAHTGGGAARRGSRGTRRGAPAWRGAGVQAGSAGGSRHSGTAAGARGPDRRPVHCGACGATAHSYNDCRFREYECSQCGRIGHLRRVCPEVGGSSGHSRRGQGGRGRSAVYHADAEKTVVEAVSQDEEDLQEDFHHLCLNDYRAVSLPIKIDTHVVQMEVDTGTAVSCVSRHTYEKYFKHIKIVESDIVLNFYDGSKIKPLGIITPMVTYGGRTKPLELFIINGGTTSLLGRQWLAELEIDIPVFSNCNKISSDNQMSKEINDLFIRYKELFSGGLGRYTGGKATLRVRDEAVPVFHRARPVPFALRGRIDAELDAMLRDGIIEPVDCSDWASPLVPPPQPPVPWEDVKDATKDVTASLQYYTQTGYYMGNEDCLYLNVYTPVLPSTKSSLLPVMVYIHGGGFVSGQGTDENNTGPDYLIEKDVVVVAINYRLGILGFLSLDCEEAPGNMGLKDQVQALKWVKNNISKFNGNSDNVTIFGLSAGGASVEYLLLSPMARGLFHQAIAQCGSSLCHWAQYSKIKQLAYKVPALNGKAIVDDKELLNYLKTLDAKDLTISAMKAVDTDKFRGAFHCGFVPVIEKPDNWEPFLDKSSYDMLKNGDFAKVPFMAGFASHEGLLMLSVGKKILDKVVMQNNFVQALPFELDTAKEAEMELRLKYIYRNTANSPKELDSSVIDYFTDVFILGGVYTAISFIAENNSHPVYFYEFSYDGNFAHVKKTLNIDREGVCHGDELGYIFKINLLNADPTPDDIMIRERMVTMWTNFAKHGNPTPRTDSLISTKWEPATANKMSCLVIGEKMTLKSEVYPERTKLFKELYETYVCSNLS